MLNGGIFKKRHAAIADIFFGDIRSNKRKAYLCERMAQGLVTTRIRYLEQRQAF